MFNFLRRKPQVITRFAPSPTGELHIGGARTALFSYLFAKKSRGKFLLRIEDTDRERFVEGATERIIESLIWLGIAPDNLGKVIIQSQRLEIYKKHAFSLLEKGDAYICTCSKEKLAADREKQTQEKKPPRYEGHCRELNIKPESVEGKDYVVRMKMPKEGSVTVKDLIRGDVVFDLSLFDDQILLKSDGYPTYHLASVVDDYEMGITHVIRAEEWLPSTPKHILLYRMFGWQMPEFGHLPMILAPDKSKLSKRHGATGIFEYKQLGYLPEAMVNFIALLGWHPRDDREIFLLKELIKEFELSRIQKAGAIFDIQKLNWLNGQYLKEKTGLQLLKMIKALYGEKITLGEDVALKLLNIGKIRMATLMDFLTLQDSLKLVEYENNLLIWKNTPKEKIKKSLRLAKESLVSISAPKFEEKSLEMMLLSIADKQGRGEFLWPLRVALSGRDKSPGPFELMAILGKEESLRRIEMAIKKLSS